MRENDNQFPCHHFAHHHHPRHCKVLKAKYATWLSFLFDNKNEEKGRPKRRDKRITKLGIWK